MEVSACQGHAVYFIDLHITFSDPNMPSVCAEFEVGLSSASIDTVVSYRKFRQPLYCRKIP